jgi:hypothetical protein
VNLNYWDHFKLFTLEEACVVIHDFIKATSEPIDKVPKVTETSCTGSPTKKLRPNSLSNGQIGLIVFGVQLYNYLTENEPSPQMASFIN